MTEVERDCLMHVLRFADLCEFGARDSARNFAKIDPYRLKNLPDLLERSLKKRADMAGVK